MSDTMCKIESVTYNIQCGLLVTLFLNTCTFQHVYFAICALCNMCTLQHVHFATHNFATCTLCMLQGACKMKLPECQNQLLYFKKQSGTELGQAQLKLILDYT